MDYETELLKMIRSCDEKAELITYARQLCESLLLPRPEGQKPSGHS